VRLTAGILLLALLGGVIVWDVVGHRPWWTHLPLFAGIIAMSVVLARLNSRYRKLRLRLTGESLELPGPDGVGRVIDWPNVARAEIRGRFSPRLTVQPVDPQLIRPPLTRWQWAAMPSRRRYELSVPLDFRIVDRRVLHDELMRRLVAGG
jgi:hypothetical protein